VRTRERPAAAAGARRATGSLGWSRSAEGQRRRRALERLLAAAAVAWLAAVALLEVAGADPLPVDVGSSPDTLVAGDAWRLLSSALIVDSALPLLQVAVTAAVTAVVLVRHGPIVWWLAALAGHVGSTLIAYALIGGAIALGSASADRVADDWDFGISCVLAAEAGVLFAGGLRRLRGGRGDARDIALVVATSLGLLATLATIDWYGIEHQFAFALGAWILVACERQARPPHDQRPVPPASR
jgi:hypothetical protein